MNMFIHFFCLCPLSLIIKLNFNIESGLFLKAPFCPPVNTNHPLRIPINQSFFTKTIPLPYSYWVDFVASDIQGRLEFYLNVIYASVLSIFCSRNKRGLKVQIKETTIEGMLSSEIIYPDSSRNTNPKFEIFYNHDDKMRIKKTRILFFKEKVKSSNDAKQQQQQTNNCLTKKAPSVGPHVEFCHIFWPISPK